MTYDYVDYLWCVSFVQKAFIVTYVQILNVNLLVGKRGDAMTAKMNGKPVLFFFLKKEVIVKNRVEIVTCHDSHIGSLYLGISQDHFHLGGAHECFLEEVAFAQTSYRNKQALD